MLRKVLEYYNIVPVKIAFLGGRMNYNWLVFTREGRYVLRMQKYRPRGMERIMEFISFLHQHKYPVPRPVRNREWKYVTREENASFILFEYLPGEPLSKFNSKILSRAAQLLARFHVLGRKWLGRNFLSSDRVSPCSIKHAFYMEYMLEYPSNIKRSILMPFYVLARKNAREIDRILQEGRAELPRTIIHGDYHNQNLIVLRGDITGVIDFDLTGEAYRVQDLANTIAWMILTRIPWQDIGHFIREYNRTWSLSRDEIRVLPFFLRYIFSLFLPWTVFHARRYILPVIKELTKHSGHIPIARAGSLQ